MAEAYWDKEWELRQQGFDYCYDKRLYDRLEHDQAETVRCISALICRTRKSWFASSRITTSLVRPQLSRSRSNGPRPSRSQPCRGPDFFHQGQFEGYRFKLPVLFRRGPAESVVPGLRDFYRTR